MMQGSADKALIEHTLTAQSFETMFGARRKISLDVLAVFFGISAWIAINGVFVELPLLVQALPEQWALASYLSVIVQVGVHRRRPSRIAGYLPPNRSR
jgi:hypothetical protein